MRPPAAAVPMRSTVAPRAITSSTLATTGTPTPTPTHSAASFPALVESTTATTSNGAYLSTPIAVFAVAGVNWPSARIATLIVCPGVGAPGAGTPGAGTQDPAPDAGNARSARASSHPARARHL